MSQGNFEAGRPPATDTDRPPNAGGGRFGYAVSDAVLAAHGTNVLNCATGAMGICVDRALHGPPELRAGRGDADAAPAVDRPARRPLFGAQLLRAAANWLGRAKASSLA